MLIDTHAHIHSKDYGLDPKEVLANAAKADVKKILCVGTDAEDSGLAVKFARDHEGCFATVGLHPHDAKLGDKELKKLEKLVNQPKVVAVGECGLDYYYNHSSKLDQEKAFRYQIELAQKHKKPLIFHVREAFTDFFKVIDKYQDLTGVVHSFSATVGELKQVLERGFYVGLNGIMTFSKDAIQLEAAKAIPLDRLLLETDSPYLTPAPHRGKVNQPANVRIVAEFLANLRSESFQELAKATSFNAKTLFGV